MLPAVSVTAEAVRLPALQTPASTISRFPVVTAAVGWRVMLAATPRLLTCWTNAGVAVSGEAANGLLAATRPPVAITAAARTTRTRLDAPKRRARADMFPAPSSITRINARGGAVLARHVRGRSLT